jgi:hypothetical protein
MCRYIKSCILVFTCCLWMGSAHLLQAVDGSEQRPSQQESPQKRPSFHVSSESFHFGEVVEGSVVTHDFIVKNTGSEILEIKNVKPG